MDIRLNRSQKMIFLMAFAVIATISIFWLFIYIPAKAKMTAFKDEFIAIQSEIDKIQKISGGEENLDAAYNKFHERYTYLKKRIPTEERSTLSALSSEADKMKIEVLVINPGKATKSDLSMEIDGKKILEMPISMDIRCDYITLGEYLNILREKLPTLISVDKINIRRGGQERHPHLLDISLYMTLFMLES